MVDIFDPNQLMDAMRGAFAIGAPNDTVRELTGKDAEDFETVARRHAALPESRQSLRVRLAVAGWAASHGIEDLVVEGGTLKEGLA